MFSWAHLGLVALGGALGTALRVTVMLGVGEMLGAATVPAVNVVGAFALGAVVGRLSRRDDARTRAARVFLGAGVLGGFTTYSALALETADPARYAWGVATLVAGAAAAWAGLLLGRRGEGKR